MKRECPVTETNELSLYQKTIFDLSQKLSQTNQKLLNSNMPRGNSLTQVKKMVFEKDQELSDMRQKLLALEKHHLHSIDSRQGSRQVSMEKPTIRPTSIRPGAGSIAK